MSTGAHEARTTCRGAVTSHETALEAAAKALTGHIGGVCCHKTGGVGSSDCECRDIAAEAISAYISTLSPDVSGLVERLRDGVQTEQGCSHPIWSDIEKADALMSEAADALASLSLQLAAAEGERDDFQRLFDQQWKRTREAGELWRKAHPGNDLVSPDLGELVKWLIERAETAEASLSAAMSNQRDQFDALCAMRNDLNELFPIPSLDSDLQNGPETSVFCAVVVKAVRDALSAAQEENERLRKIISDSAEALGNGAFIAPTCSIDFMSGLPNEIKLHVATLSAPSKEDAGQ